MSGKKKRKPTDIAASVLGKELEQLAGSREEAIAVLRMAPSERKLTALIDMLADPRNNQKTFGQVAAAAHVDVMELFKHCREAILARAQLMAIVKVGDRLAVVANDVMQRSIEHDAVCEQCGGSGKRSTRYGVVRCEACQETGRVKMNPDPNTQRMALELGGVLQKSGGVQLNVNNNTATVGAMNFGSVFRQFQQDSDRALSQPVLEAHVEVEEEERIEL